MSAPFRSMPSRSVGVALALGFSVVIALSFLRSPIVALVAAGGIAVIGASVHRPAIATQCVLLLLYSNLPAVSVAFHGVPKVVAAAFPLLLLIPLASDVLLRRLPPVLTSTFAVLLLLLAVQAAGAAFARDGARALQSTATFALEGVLLYFLLTNVIRTRQTMVGATWSLIAAGVLMSALPLYQQITGTFGNAYGGLAQVEGGGFSTGEVMEDAGAEEQQARLSGPIGETNRYAQIMLVLVPLALSRVFSARTPLLRLVAIGATAWIALGFALAFSRGGAVGLAAMMVAAVALRLVSARKAALVAVGLTVVLAAMPQYWQRLETIGTSVRALDGGTGAAEADGAVRRRLTSMMAATRVFLDHPLIGVGPGEFLSYSQEYGNDDALRRIEDGRRAHSLYLEIAAENGAIGLSLFLAALAMTVHGLAVARRACLGVDPGMADLCTGYLLALVCYLSTGLFLHLSYLRYFALLLGLCGAATEVALRESRSGGDVEAELRAAAGAIA